MTQDTLLLSAYDSGPLTVSDLITALSTLPPDLEVLIPGYEGGFSPIAAIKQDTLLTNVNNEWYYGPHDELDSVSDPDSYKKQDFIILNK